MNTSYRYQKDTIGGNFWEIYLDCDFIKNTYKLEEIYLRSKDHKVLKHTVKDLTFRQAFDYKAENVGYLIEKKTEN